MEEVILVNSADQELGTMEKMEAHKKGVLHRAFSVFIFNEEGEMLLQQRALNKYHSAGLWTNACCSHQRIGETSLDAAKRRLKEEMGLACELKFKTTFIYKSEFENGLTEHELDHVFTGICNDTPVINKDEVENYKWVKPETIKKLMDEQPEHYTTWFRIAIKNLF